MFKEILLPIDLEETDLTLRAIAIAQDLADRYGARITVVTVIPDFNMPVVASYFPKDAIERARKEVCVEMEKLVKARFADPDNVRCDVGEGSPHKFIVTYARDKQIDLMIEMRVAEAGSEDAFWLDTQDYYQHAYEVCQFSGPANAAGQSRFLEVRVFVDAPDGALPRVSEDTEDKTAKSAKLKQIPGTDAVVYSSTNVKKDLTDHYVYIDAGRFSAVLDGLAWSSSSGPSGYEPEVDVKPIVLAIQDALKKA